MISGELYRNRDGVTQTRRIPEAATINGITILINEATELPARNAAGHEAYHFWKNDSERTVYEEAVKDNLLFTSDQYMWYQNEIAQTYFNDSGSTGGSPFKRNGAAERRRLTNIVKDAVYNGTNFEEARQFIAAIYGKSAFDMNRNDWKQNY